jgi:hypothetical protein
MGIWLMHYALKDRCHIFLNVIYKCMLNKIPNKFIRQIANYMLT